MGAKSYVFLVQDISSLHLYERDVGYIEREFEQQYEIFFLRTGKIHSIDKSELVLFDIALTGDRYANKVCDRCYRCLNTDLYFENNRIKKDNIITKRPSCRDCRKIKNGVAIPSKQRTHWEDNRPVNGSLFTCPICKKTTIVGISKVVLDHNHATGNVRGWLCESCNTGIGRFDDDEEIIQHSIDWLRKTNR